MRLRLRIERNSLPITQALWPVKDGKFTIAQLLQHINETFPLESDTWGLEDYSVSVGGYECLHWHEIQVVCKEDDEVTIKALQWVDVRARTLTGRAQVSQDGRHLVDGVPFGRPCLKGPTRPDITIPPRKRRKLLRDNQEDVSAGQLQLAENGEDLDFQDDEDEGDDDFNVDDFKDSLSSDTSSSEEDSESSGNSDSDSTDTSSSDSSSSDSSDSESESHVTRKPSKTPIAQVSQTAPKGSRQTSTVSLSANRTSKGKKRPQQDEVQEPRDAKRKELSAASGPDLEKTSGETTSNGVGAALPNEGKQKTKDRNARRREARMLKALKDQNKLPKDATLHTLRQLQHDTDGDQTSQQALVQSAAAPNGIETEMDDAQSGAPKVKVSEASTSGTIGKKRKRGDEFDQQRQKLLSAIESGGVDVTTQRKASKTAMRTEVAEEDDDEPPTELSTKASTPAGMGPSEILEDDLNVAAAAGTPASVQPRKQLDLASSKRLLFGSLGVRVPKTQEERDRTQEKLAGRAKRNTLIQNEDSGGEHVNGTSTPDATEVEVTNQMPEAPDAWKTKIHLTAVECCQEGVKLSTPPFPFYQRWDPQQRTKKNRNSNTYQTRNGTSQKRAYVQETYDKYNTNGEGDGLEYDDVEADDEYWEDGALLGDDYEEDDGKEVEVDDGFPPVPNDLDTLTAVLEEDANAGDFIAYAELACDEHTEWQPMMVTRLAKIHERLTDDDGATRWAVEMSGRDRKAKTFDEDGNRVYSKFEMPGDDAEDDGRKEVRWQELGDVRMVLRAEREVGGEV